jgi:lipoate-protein ligase A
VTAPQWRIWTYAAPAIVLGCSQRALRPALEAQLRGRLPVVEREAGGGAVLTGPWLLGLSLVLPPGHAWLSGGLLPSYQNLGQLHVEALQALGIGVRAVPPPELPSRQSPREPDPLAWACFGGLSPWEVVDAQGRKLVGLAQRRRQTGALLVAGTLLCPPDWPLLCEAHARAHDAALLCQRTVSCEQLLGRPLPAASVSAVLTRRLRQALT